MKGRTQLSTYISQNYTQAAMTDLTIEIMVGGISGFLICGGISFYYVNKMNREDTDYKLKVFREKRRNILKEATYRTNAVNALVLKVHNDGGELAQAKTWYSSVVDEYPKFETVSAKDDWQNIPADDTYRDLITSIKRNGSAYPITEAMKPSDLKGTYTEMKIDGSVVMAVHSDAFFFYYISFPTFQFEKVISNEAEIQRFKSYQRKMQRLYQQYEKYDILRIDWIDND